MSDAVASGISIYILVAVLWGFGMAAALGDDEMSLAILGGILWPIFLPICIFAAIAKAARA